MFSNARFVLMLAFVVGMFCIPQLAQAKWSKACTDFTYDGVSVKVIDRHKEIGQPYDTYGYTIYKNNTDQTLTVNWRAYGVLNKHGKLVKVNDDSFVLSPGEERKELYSYTGGLYHWRHFEKYVVAIEVTKGAKLESPEKMCNYVKRNEADLTKDDYTRIVDWCVAYYNASFLPLVEEMAEAMEKKNLSDEEIEVIQKKIDNKWPDIKNFLEVGDVVQNAYDNNELDYEDCKKWESVLSKAEEFMRYLDSIDTNK